MFPMIFKREFSPYYSYICEFWVIVNKKKKNRKEFIDLDVNNILVLY